MNERFRRGEEGPEAGARSVPAATPPTHPRTTDVGPEPHAAREAETTVREPRFDRDEHAPRHAREEVVDRDTGSVGRTGLTAGTMRDVRARQREEFGGLNWGSAFFGWLVAIGVAVILLAILSAAGTAFGLSENVSQSDANSNADTLSIVGGILLILVLAIAYYCGGYVSGRM